jgi:aspergillopepsin I
MWKGNAWRRRMLMIPQSRLNTVNPTQQKTWFDNARAHLQQPLFAVALKRKAPGAYDFGFLDRKKYTGEILWVPLRSGRGFWDFTATGFQVGSGPMKTGNINAVADTGSSLWYMPKAFVDQYWQQVPGAQFGGLQSAWMFPCNAKLPDISVQVANKKITVPGINMNYQQAGASNCFGGLQADKGMPFSIFGDVFLKSLYVVFEHQLNGQPRLGFAHQPKTGQSALGVAPSPESKAPPVKEGEKAQKPAGKAPAAEESQLEIPETLE